MRHLLLALILFQPIHAAIKKIHLTERSDVLDGAAMGSAGPYERMIGTAFFEFDPAVAANRLVTDIDFAPRNSHGLVEYSADLYVLKPRDPAKANGTVLFEVVNRGNMGLLNRFHLHARAGSDPRTPADFGDRFLLEQGYTLVWLGWQMDLTSGIRTAQVRAHADITGPVRATYVSFGAREFPLSTLNPSPYLPLPNLPVTLSMRSTLTSPPSPVNKSKWRIEKDTLTVDGGFERGGIYELIYTSSAPLIDGLGMAGVRDLVSFLKYGGIETMLNDQRRFMKRAIGFGTSQSGRWLRSFLYDGFNADEQGRRVFDGLWAHVAGAGRGSFNQRFAHPTVAGNSTTTMLYPVDIFPFSDVEQTDSELGIKDGLLKRAIEAKAAPRVFYTNSSVEYWARVASLATTTLDASADVPLGADTRMYFLTGTQHGPSSFPPAAATLQHKRNPGEYRWALRALLVAMQDWLKDGKEPPASQYPSIAARTLVHLKEVRFPQMPQASFPTFHPPVYRLDFGPEFRSKRVITRQPPGIGKPYTLLFPQVDDDGNERAGIRLPHIRVPLATYTGWNFEVQPLGRAEVLAGLSGSWLPFAPTKEKRAPGDSRPSIAERYPSKDVYLKKVADAVRQLAAERYVLERDLEEIVSAASGEWDYVTAQ